jgi:hypothetical protein
LHLLNLFFYYDPLSRKLINSARDQVKRKVHLISISRNFIRPL